MIPLSPARRAAEEFASLVDGTRGESSERYADLLTFVDVLRTQEPPAPRVDFTVDLRTRLMEAADTLLVPGESTRLAPVVSLEDAAKRRQRRISVVAAAFVVVGGTAGVAAASNNALPGDPLYPLKRGIENARTSVRATDTGKGQDLLSQGNTRLAEIERLIADKQSTTDIEKTLGAFSDSATNGAEKFFIAYQRDQDTKDIARLRALLGSQLNTLDELADKAPSGTQDAFAAARARLVELDDQARALCNCDPGTSSLSSGPALASLLVGPAYQASGGAGEADVDSDLAGIADKIAQHTPTSSATPSTPATPALPGQPTAPSTGQPGLPTGGVAGKNPVGGVLGGVNDGVSSLLREVSAATGGALDPLVNAVTDTLDKVTNPEN